MVDPPWAGIVRPAKERKRKAETSKSRFGIFVCGSSELTEAFTFEWEKNGNIFGTSHLHQHNTHEPSSQFICELFFNEAEQAEPKIPTRKQIIIKKQWIRRKLPHEHVPRLCFNCNLLCYCVMGINAVLLPHISTFHLPVIRNESFQESNHFYAALDARRDSFSRSFT